MHRNKHTMVNVEGKYFDPEERLYNSHGLEFTGKDGQVLQLAYRLTLVKLRTNGTRSASRGSSSWADSFFNYLFSCINQIGFEIKANSYVQIC